MVAVPRVKNGLAFPVRYASRLVERGLGVVGFAERMFVQDLKSTVRRGLPFFFAQITMR